MKHKMFMTLAFLLAGFVTLHAQNFQRRTVEERVKAAMEKLAPLSLDKDKTTQTDSIFTEFYKAQDKAFEDMRNSGSMDREAMMAKRKELADARDEKLKKIFTDDQFKKFKEEIEPSMTPQRRNGGGGNK